MTVVQVHGCICNIIYLHTSQYLLREVRISLQYGELLLLDKPEMPCLQREELKEMEKNGYVLDIFRYAAISLHFNICIDCTNKHSLLLFCSNSCLTDYVTKQVPCYANGRGNSSFPCTSQDLDKLTNLLTQLPAKGESQVLFVITYLPMYFFAYYCVRLNLNQNWKANFAKLLRL